jgi:hypothetical protein
MSTFKFEWKANRNFCVTAKSANDFQSEEGQAAVEAGTFLEFALTGEVSLIGYFKTEETARKAMVGCWNSEEPTHPWHYSFMWNRAGESVDGCY